MAARLLAALLALLMTVAPASAESRRILLIGDSLLAAHRLTGRSVALQLERYLGQDVEDRSVLGARMVYTLPVTGALGLSIPKQYRGEDWDWVIVSGGGNDLWMGCGCRRCHRKLDQMVSASGTSGEVPTLMDRIRKTGARVLVVGYLRSPGINTPIESCKDEGDAFEARLTTMAGKMQGVDFLPLTDLVPHGDPSWLALDGIHPSAKASREIARRLAAFIQSAR